MGSQKMKYKAEFRDSPTIIFFTGSAIIIFILNIFYGVTINWMMAITLGLFISIAVLNYLYEKNVPGKLKVEILDKEIRKYKGQDDILKIKVTQQGYMPLLSASMVLYAGDDIRFHHDISTGIRNHSETKVAFTVLPKHSVIIEIPFTAHSRGVSKIVKSEILIPKLFGFDSLKLRQTGKIEHEIIIYPDRLAIKNSDMKNQMTQGLFMQNNALFPDPLISSGTRDYMTHDNIRDINWKATARTGELKTKIHQKTTRISWMILINLRSENTYAPPENIEEIFEKTAYITGRATEEDIPYRIMTNMATFDKDKFFKLNESSGKLHYKKTLEALAKIKTLTFTMSFDRFLRHVLLHEELPTHIIFTGKADSLIDDELKVFKAKGAKVFQLDELGVTPYGASDSKGAAK